MRSHFGVTVDKMDTINLEVCSHSAGNLTKKSTQNEVSDNINTVNQSEARS